MARIAENFDDEPVFQAEAIEEIRLGEDGVLHIFHLGVLEQKSFDHLLLHVTDDKEIDLALATDERASEEDELHVRQGAEALHERTLALDGLGEHVTKVLVQREFRIHVVVLLPVLVARLHQTDLSEVLEFTSDAVDLLVQEARQFTDEILLFRVEQKRRQKLHPCLGAE